MKRFLFIVLLIIFTGVTVFAQTDLQPAAIVRLTKSEPITVKQLRTKCEEVARELATRQGRNLSTAEITAAINSFSVAQRKEILDLLINERLTLQAAERDKVTVTDNELNQQLQQLRTQMAQTIGRQPTEDEFALAIRNETGQDYPAFRDQLRRQMIVQRYLMSKKSDLLNNIPQPTDAEVINSYNLSKAQFVRPDTVRFSMIQVPYGPDTASRARAKELADRLAREINTDPTKFDEAVQRGQAPNAGYQAGDIGYRPLIKEFQDTAGTEFFTTISAMKHGEVSKLINGTEGFQIVKVTEKLPQKFLELDDIARPGVPLTVREGIRRTLLAERQQVALTRATQELVTELRVGNPFQVMEANLNW